MDRLKLHEYNEAMLRNFEGRTGVKVRERDSALRSSDIDTKDDFRGSIP